MWIRHSEETIAIIAKCAENGMTQAETAAQLGVKRNVIVGLAYRQKIKFDGPPNGGRPKTEKPPKQAKAVSRVVMRSYMKCEAITEREPQPVSGSLTFNELTPTSCRYAFGDRDFTFCPNEKFMEYSWCRAHCAIVFQPR